MAIVHMAGEVLATGTSALCFVRPHVVGRRSSWTLKEKYVTCGTCKRLLKLRAEQRCDLP